MQNSETSMRQKASLLCVFVSILVLGIKILAYYVTRSSAVLSDALETVVNVIAALVGFAVIRYTLKPKDKDHPYGHGKAEYFSAAFEGGLILFASLVIFVESVDAFLNPRELMKLDLGMLLITVATALNLLTALYLRKMGKKVKSETLLASSVHLMSDVVTTFGVLIGLGIVHLSGLQWVDGFATMLISIYLGFEGYKIVRRSISGLTDEMDDESLEALSESIQKHRKPGIIDIHNVRAIRSGSFHHIDAHLVLPEFWDVARAHEISHEFEKKVVADYTYDGEFAFHMDPCKRKYCEFCDVKDCPVRRKEFKSVREFGVKDIIGGPIYE